MTFKFIMQKLRIKTNQLKPLQLFTWSWTHFLGDILLFRNGAHGMLSVLPGLLCSVFFAFFCHKFSLRLGGGLQTKDLLGQKKNVQVKANF